MDKPAMPGPPEKPAPGSERVGADQGRALRAEAIGIIVIALAILIYTILRYGAHINWSAR